MCGIYGYIGKNSIKEVLTGLKKLEYRGYDSAGIAFQGNDVTKGENVFVYNGFSIIKSAGQISKLEEFVKKASPKSEVAIAHTRWATHGAPGVINSHPHASEDGKWAIVHNGIIENYNDLKKYLDVPLKSETDTEVVVQLLQKLYNGDVLKTIRDVCQKLEGSYAFAIITSHQPDKIFVAKKGSPVVVGYGEGHGIVCSDLNSITDVSEAYLLKDRQFAVVERDRATVYDCNLKEVSLKNLAKIDRQIKNGLGRYKHYMLKEIDEIPSAIKRTVQGYDSFEKIRKALPLKIARKVKSILFIGCGTAYHAGLIGKNLFQNLGIKVENEIASEFRYSSFVYEKDTLAVFISQSGETADTLRALSLCKEKGLTTLAITNVQNSTICFEADRLLFTKAGAEIAVASTKAYNCQLAMIYLLAAYFESIKTGKREIVRMESDNLIEIASAIYANRIKPLCRKVAEEIYNSKSVYMIGRGEDYFTAKEASLKLKEISYIHCEAYPAGELKHGTISLIDKDTYVFAFLTQSRFLDKTQSNVKEIESRQGKIIELSPYKINKKGLYRFIKLPEIKEKFMPLFVINYMQLIAYYTSLKLGFNPDKPRSLAKSVTVE